MSSRGSSAPQQRAPRPRPPLPTGTKVLLGLLLGVPVVIPLAVPLYAKESPDLGGIPFFFWAQFAMIPIASLMTWAAYVVVTRHESSGGSR